MSDWLELAIAILISVPMVLGFFASLHGLIWIIGRFFLALKEEIDGDGLVPHDFPPR